jgi:hypothetical protein
MFAAAVTGCDPGRIRLVKYALALCDAVSVLLIGAIAALLWPARGAATAASLLAAVHPFFWGAVLDVRSEPLFMVLMLGGMVFLLRGRNLASGIAIALAALVRPTGLLCIPLFALFAVMRSRRLLPAVMVVLGALAALGPWTVRNYVRFGEWIAVNDAAGFNLWRGTHPETLRIVSLESRAEYERAIVEFETETVHAAAGRVEAAAATPAARDRLWRALALEQIRVDRSAAVRSTAVKALLFWRPWLHPLEHDLPLVFGSFLVTFVVYGLGMIGLGTSSSPSDAVERRASPETNRRIGGFSAPAALVFIAAMWTAHMPYVPTIRLRAPLVDPLMIVFGAGPLSAAAARRREDEGGGRSGRSEGS